MQRGWRILFLGAGLAVAGHAVVFESTDDPAHNTTAPTGSLTNSGWQLQGVWLSYLGTPIAPRYFITAKHVGGTTNDLFGFNNLYYHPVGYTDCPTADLRVWRVAETFPRYAPLHTGTGEVGQAVVVFGRGAARGAPVVVGGVTNGWRWGTGQYWVRWGENSVTGITNLGAGWGDMLACAFDRGAGANEAHLSTGDSSGALFLRAGGAWQLAGIHTTVDGPFSNAVDGTTFNAVLLDMGGLYNDGVYVPDTPADQPSSFYSTRIAANAAWIQSVIDSLPGPDLATPSITVTGAEARVTFFAASNRLYRVERSDDLQAWTAWTNNVPGTNGPVTLIDGVTGSRRYYRLGLDR